MNIHELYQAYCLYRHDNFSYGSQLITGQGQGDSYRVCASATLYSILAVWLQSLRVDCHVVMLSLSLLACALITMRVFFDLHLLDGFYEDTKESHCWKIKAAIKAWSGFFFSLAVFVYLTNVINLYSKTTSGACDSYTVPCCYGYSPN